MCRLHSCLRHPLFAFRLYFTFPELHYGPCLHLSFCYFEMRLLFWILAFCILVFA